MIGNEILDTSTNSVEDVNAALADPNLSFDEFERIREGRKPAEPAEAPAPEAAAAPEAEAPEEAAEPEAAQGEHKASGWKRTKEERDRLRIENRELREALANPPKEKTEAAEYQPAPGEPTIDQFRTHGEYMRAWKQWDKAEEAVADRLKAHQQRLAEAKKTHGDDFTEAMGLVNAMQVFPNTADAITESPHSAEILFHLGRDPKEVQRFQGLSEREQIKEVGRIEARLTDAGNAPSPKPTAARSKPAPITPIRGASQAAMTKPLAEMSDEEFERTRNKQEMQWRASR